MRCDPDVRRAPRTPVLLVHGAFSTRSWWAPTYLRALPADGHPTCTLELPGRLAVDLQRAAEYVVYAVRTVTRLAGRPGPIVGHSQGAFLASFALRFWPDLGGRITDFVGLAGVYERGSALGTAVCAAGCPASAWQLRPGSKLLRAYAARELYRGPAYTAMSTAYDEIVVPQPEAGRLGGAVNIVLQDVCPVRPVEHGLITADAVAYALALDAIEHAGPADPLRLPAEVCRRALLPGTDWVGLAAELGWTALGLAEYAAHPVAAEPAVRCPIDPACTRPRLQPRLRLAAGARSRRIVFVRGTLVLPPGAINQCSGTVQVRASAPGWERIVRAALTAACRFAAPVVARRAPVRVTARYAGSTELLPARAVLRSRRLR